MNGLASDGKPFGKEPALSPCLKASPRDICDDSKGVERKTWQVPMSRLYLPLATPLPSKRGAGTAGPGRLAPTPVWRKGCTPSLWLLCASPCDSPHFSAARLGRRTRSTEKTECVSGNSGEHCVLGGRGGGRGRGSQTGEMHPSCLSQSFLNSHERDPRQCLKSANSLPLRVGEWGRYSGLGTLKS